MARLLLLIVVSALFIGCGDDSPSTPPDSGGEPDAGYPEFTRIPESEAEAGRQSCRFQRGAMPWETVGEEFPIGRDIPIDHIIMVMQENRSFDHYFGAMEGVIGFSDTYTNPDATGADVAPYHETEYCIEDVRHSWRASHEQYNDGLNDGFVLTNEPNGIRALGYFTDDDLPFYWDLYSTFAMSDKHHCSVLAGTWTNRFYYMSGTSFGGARNGPIPEDRLEDPPYVLFQQLDEKDIDWHVYNNDVPFVFGGYPQYAGRNISRISPYEQFLRALDEGTLPPVTFIDPSFTVGVEQTDEHPPATPQAGQKFIHDLVKAAMASSLWPRMAIVVTYDEHGGFFDSVPPPEACVPGDYPPDIDADEPPGDYDRLGFRVPLVVVSPYSRASYISDRTTDLTSVLRFVQTRFLLPALTGRDANAWPMLDMFDFENPPFMTPPDLAEAVIDEAKLDRCRMLFPDSGRL